MNKSLGRCFWFNMSAYSYEQVEKSQLLYSDVAVISYRVIKRIYFLVN
jgi:hypothetical protein